MQELKKIFLTFAILMAVSPFAWSQEEEEVGDDDLDIIEMEVERSAQKRGDETVRPSSEKEEINFSGLGTLAPFTEVSVIQKRYMPKTDRFQLFGGVNWVTNNPFFDTYGFSGKAAWFMSETWGLEFSYMMLTTAEAKATQELRELQNVATDNLVYPKSYMGLDLMWLPIYGKFTWFNDQIIPYDMYFSIGYGQTGVQNNDKPGTIHLSTGQIFALSKSMALRWDFSWNSFTTTSLDGNSGPYNMLFLTVGLSFFVPEADYR